MNKSFSQDVDKYPSVNDITLEDRIQVKKIASEMEDVIDNTEYLRKEKYSQKLSVSIGILEKLKRDHADLRRNHPQEFSELCQSKCRFLYDRYTSLFHRLLKDEIDLQIMKKVVYVMKMIEDEKIDHTEGSILVGKLFKEMYIDSGLRHGEKFDEENPPEPKNEGVALSWKEYKQRNAV